MMGEEWTLCLKIKVAISLLYALSQISLTSAVGAREAFLYGAIEVVDYKQYSSAQLLRFLVPQQANRASWLFRAFTLPHDCTEKVISIHLQVGSYPLVAPNNETFPDGFHLERTAEHTLSVNSKNESLIHTVHYPLPGEWYAAAFTTSLHDKIVQKGLSPGCQYFLQSELSVDVHREIKTLEKRQDSLHIHARSQKIARFLLDEPAWEYRVKVTGCGEPTDAPISNFYCNISLSSRSSALPDQAIGQGQTTCILNTNDDCAVRVASPDVGSWQYVTFINHGEENINIQIVVESQVCPYAGLILAIEDYNNSEKCRLLSELDKYRGYGDYRSNFGVLTFSTIIIPQVLMFGALTQVIPFSLEPRLDIGGTLKVKLTAKILFRDEDMQVLVVGCLQRGSIGFTGGTSIPCEDKPTTQLLLNITENPDGVIYIPYPEPGTWYLSLRMMCYHIGLPEQSVDCDNITAGVEVDISTAACVDGGCDNSGQCFTFLRGASRLSSCQCVAGWRGYGCNDGREAASFSEQTTEVLLLTLSNLLFLPAIIIALRRRFFAEALVYSCTMFFSTFYHACDGDRQLTYCITTFDTLGACDFFGSVLAFWATLTAMIQVKEPYLPMLMIAGAIGLVYGVLEDKHSLWLFVAPAISGVTLLIISWGLRCHRRRRCYPSWRRYVFCLLPGVACAGVGLCLFAFVETDQNYKYIHSLWHVSMAISIVFVLPPRPAWRSTGMSLKHKDNDSDCKRVIDSTSDHQESNGGIVNVCMSETV